LTGRLKREEEKREKIWQLICRSRDGDERAFEELVVLRREPIFWLAYQMLGNEDDAKEIAQLAFIKLWRVLKKFKETKSFDFWLRRLVTNLCLDELRKRKRERALISSAVERTKELSTQQHLINDGLLIEKELHSIFNRISAKLSPRQKTAFVLMDMQGLSTTEVSKIMGCSKSTVRNHLMLARRFMRQQIINHYPEYIKKQK
jgi:RNA polymerase sigma-70 factor (ECF subfamily)